MTCHTKLSKTKTDVDMGIKAQLLGPGLDSKFEELKYEIIHKIDKEMMDSHNAREYISQKYDELCHKIQYLTELDATVTGFRSDVKGIERQIAQLASRVDAVERRAAKDCPSTSTVVSTNKLL